MTGWLRRRQQACHANTSIGQKTATTCNNSQARLPLTELQPSTVGAVSIAPGTRQFSTSPGAFCCAALHIQPGFPSPRQATFVILDAALFCFVTFVPHKDSLPKMEEGFWEEDTAGLRNSLQGSPVDTHPNRPTEGRDRETRPERAGRPGWLERLIIWNDSGNQPAQNEALIRVLQSQVQEAEAQIHLLQSQLQEAQSNLRREQDANRRLHQKAKAIESERNNISLSMKNQEAQIRQVQALAFVGIGGDSWAAGDDGTVRTELENLHIRVKNWAKKYATEDIGAAKGLPSNEHGSFIQLLAEVVRLRSGAQNVIEHLESGPIKKKAPAMCLQGLLAHHVYAKIISRPFFVLGDAGETLQSVYMEIRQGEIIPRRGSNTPT